MMLKPWMVVNHRGFILCLQCPQDRVGRDGSQYYLALRPKRTKRVATIRWWKAHRRCGFEGLMT